MACDCNLMIRSGISVASSRNKCLAACFKKSERLLYKPAIINESIFVISFPVNRAVIDPFNVSILYAYNYHPYIILSPDSFDELIPFQFIAVNITL